MNKTITVKELSKKLGINYSLLLSHLGRFSKYLVTFEAARYKYKYTKTFLTDLKKWYEYKIENCNCNHYHTFDRAVKNLDLMIANIDN